MPFFASDIASAKPVGPAPTYVSSDANLREEVRDTRLEQYLKP